MDECVICLKALPKRNMRALLCGHQCFHHTCIAAWLAMAPTCPMCKQVVVTLDEGRECKRVNRARRRTCMEAGLGRVSQADEDLLLALELSMLSNQ